MEVAKVILL